MTISGDYPSAKPQALTSPGQAKLYGTVLLLLAAAAWGLGNVSQKTILDHLDPFAANGITCLVGALVLYPFARREGAPASTGSFWLMAKVALLFTLAATLMQLAYAHTTVTNAGFLANTAAVLTPLIGWLIYAQRPPALIWPASLCALAGLYLMGGGGLSALVYGDLLALAAALFYAFWNLLLAQYVVRHGRPGSMTVMQLLICGGVCMGVSAVWYGVPTPSAIWAAAPEIVVLGVLSKAGAYVLMALGLRYISAAKAAVLVSAESVVGAACAMVILSESPGPIRLIGGFLIIGGVILASCAPAKIKPDQRAV